MSARPSRAIRRVASMLLLAALPFSASADLVINEVDYDQASTDAAEFLEIKNTSGASIDLSLYELVFVNGSNTTVYDTIALSGSLPGGAYLVVCANASTVPNCDIDDGPNTNFIQNGNPDAVAIRFAGAGAVVDAVSYGGQVTGFFEGPGTAISDTASANTGISRAPDGTDSEDNAADFALRCITPGYANSADSTNCPTPVEIPTGPELSIDDVSAAEGNSGTTDFVFTVALGLDASGTFSVDYRVDDGTATVADSDYADTSGSLVFTDGTAGTQTITVQVNGDISVETDETFTVVLENVQGATVGLADDTGLGTVTNDDVAPIEIFDIQGSGLASPFDGQFVITEDNIVTAVGPDGFAIQTPDLRDDGDLQTSNGIYVFTGGTPMCDDGGSPRAVVVGDEVTVEATVDEYFNLTELVGAVATTCTASGQALPTAVVFQLDASGDVPSRDPDALYCGSIGGAQNNFECLEGMLVSIPQGIATTGNQRFCGSGQICGDDPSDDAYGPVHIGPHGTRSLREPGVRFGNTTDAGNAAAGSWDGNPEILEMDADRLGAVPLGTEIVGGAEFSATAIVAYSFSDYELWPVTLAIDDATNVLPRAVRARLDDQELSIGSFNVLRLCNTLDDQPQYECDGGGSGTGGEPSQAELDEKLLRLSDYIVNVLGTPDVLGVQEVETQGVLEDLAARIQLDAGVTYTAYLIEGNDGGGIDNGYLVREDRISVDSVTQLRGGQVWFDPSAPSGESRPLHDRPPLLLVGEFATNAGGVPLRFAVMNNHTKSRSGVDNSNASGQRNRAKRFHQALAIAEEVQAFRDTNPGVPIVLVGDYNDYQFSDGYAHIVGLAAGTYDNAANGCAATLSDGTPEDCDLDAGNVVAPPLLSLVDVVAMLEPNEAYSFLFSENFGNVQGQARDVPTSQVLDHVLVDVALEPMVSEVAYGRANIDASLRGADIQSGPDGAGGTQASPAIGSSDHDGLVAIVDTDCSVIPTADDDSDGVCNLVDNCAAVANPAQEDGDSDGTGDACDTAPPTIGDVADLSIDEDTSTGPLAFTTSDADSVVTCGDVSGSSDDQLVVPDANIVVSGVTPACEVTITPLADANGGVTITLTVSDGNDSASDTFVLTVDAVDDLPVAVDDAFTVDEDSANNQFLVLANDTDVDGGPMVVDGHYASSHGTTSNSSGAVFYTPDANYCGPDSFDYELNGGSTATISVTVTCIDDAAVANDDATAVSEDSGLTFIDVLDNDTDVEGDAVTVTGAGPATHGTVTFGAGGVSYVPAANYCGPDAFDYTVNGGDTATVTLDVTCVNDAPVASDDDLDVVEDAVLNVAAVAGVLANDSDVEGNALTASLVAGASNGTLSLEADGSLVYTPDADFCGSDSFSYAANDGVVDSNVATATIEVACVDDAAVAVDDTATMFQTEGSVDIDVLANDTDAEDDAFAVIAVGTPADGAASHDGSTVTYTPDPAFCGSDSFDYSITGGATATISVSVVCGAPNGDVFSDGFEVP